MKIIVALLACVLTALSTGVLLYVSMATGLGPWMAPTIVLIGGFLLRLFSQADHKSWQHDTVILQAISSTGGALATAIGFSLPTFYFLTPELFAQWLASPISFACSLGAFTIAAGWWGIWVARTQSAELLADDSLSFPVGDAIFQTISSQTHKAARWLLSIGVACAGAIGFICNGWGQIAPLISRTIYVGSLRVLPIEIMPVSWAIGFLAGMPIVLPLIVGMVSKYLVVWPLNMHCTFLPIQLFTPLSALDFTFAFCSGIVLSQAVYSFFTLPQLLWKSFSQLESMSVSQDVVSDQGWYELLCRYEWLLATLSMLGVFWYFSFPLLAQVMMLSISYLLLRHLNAFACRTGLGAYGRYMTYTMVPVMVATTINDLQITMLCMFIGIAGAAGVDMLFSYHVARMADIPEERIHQAQLFGVVVTALCVGGLFWLLCSHFELGSIPLVAHRGQARALLLHSFSMHWMVLVLGALYGMVLKRLRINPILAFGGLIMPNHITIALAFGASIRALSREPEHYTPFWSGVFAGDALWVLCSLLG